MPNGLFDWLSARIGSDFVKATVQNVQQRSSSHSGNPRS